MDVESSQPVTLWKKLKDTRPYQIFRVLRHAIKNKEFRSLLSDREFQGAVARKTLLYTTDYGCIQKPRDWGNTPTGHPLCYSLIANNDKQYAALIDSFSKFSDSFKKIGIDFPSNNREPYWNNGWFPMGDGISLYCLLALNNPNLYIEVGSENSTKFARQAIADHGLKTKIISIDPAPRQEIDLLCDQVIRGGLESVDLNVFKQLGAGDILFVDCSHRSYQNSDVTVFFTEILPYLSSNVLWGLHDICLPFDYPLCWLNKHERYYNEQYLLMSYLLGGGGNDAIHFPVAYLCSCKPEFYSSFMESFGEDIPWGSGIPSGGAFWMRKK